MKKKEIKKTKIKKAKKKVEITPSQFGMVLEDVNSKLDLLIEGFSTLNGQIEGVDKRVETLDGKVDRNHQEFVEFKGEMMGFKKEFIDFRSETDNNFKANFEYLSKIDDEIQSIKLEIENLKSELIRKADLNKLSQLEKRIFILEKGYRKFNFNIPAH